ncbi:hypothetical protein Brsp01_35010 [Brucella sp. NBRC 12950]|nr:hypothetical protein Brsp01_35010 [Brucella sp. NBRC 12950]
MYNEHFPTLSMIINNFNIKRMAVLKPEAYAPRAIDIHSPLPFSVALQWMKVQRLQRTKITQGAGRMQG